MPQNQNYDEIEGTLIAEGNLSRPQQPDRAYFFKEMLSILSEEAQEVCKLVFDSPAELMEMAIGSREKGINKNNLTKYLHHQGWPFRVIKSTFKEIKSGLKELGE